MTRQELRAIEARIAEMRAEHVEAALAEMPKIVVPPDATKQQLLADVKEAHARGLRTVEIAALVKRHPTTVREVLRELGLESHKIPVKQRKRRQSGRIPRVKALLVAGWSDTAIHQATGMAVPEIARLRGAKTKESIPAGDERDNAVRRLSLQGKVDAEIAAEVGCSRTRITEIRHRLGISAQVSGRRAIERQLKAGGA